MTLRLIRIAGFSAGLAYLFHLSRMAGLARGNEELPGTLVAIGILSALFLVRAAVTESLTEGPATVQKDLLWGLSLGGIITIVVRLVG